MGMENKGIKAWPVLLMLLLAAAARMGIALLIPGYGVDIGCFTYWGEFMAHTGAADFYNTVGFCDYPPGYILVLGLLGKLGDALGTGMTELLVKLPSILCDIAAAAVLYGFAKKRVPARNAFVLSALYAFNPLTFAAGAAWGQADSVMALCLLLVVIFAIENRWAAALPLYMLSVLLKPQALMFGPLGLMAFLYALIRQKDKRLFVQSVVGMCLAALVALAIILPFSPHMDNSEGWWVVNLYSGTMGYYANVTVNACNLYFLFGLNWIGVADEAAWYIREYFQHFAASYVPHLQRAIRMFGIAKRIPALFMRISVKSFGTDAGFEYEFPESSGNEARFNIVHCPYYETCKRYGCPEITHVFCDGDDAGYGNLHPKLIWGRTKTIGRGGDCCDFLLKHTE